MNEPTQYLAPIRPALQALVHELYFKSSTVRPELAGSPGRKRNDK